VYFREKKEWWCPKGGAKNGTRTAVADLLGTTKLFRIKEQKKTALPVVVWQPGCLEKTRGFPTLLCSRCGFCVWKIYLP